MIPILLLFAAYFLYSILRIRKAEDRARLLQSRLALFYSDQERRNKDHLRELERERALTKAVVEELAECPSIIDIDACMEEMDRLEVLDLIDEIDEENSN